MQKLSDKDIKILRENSLLQFEEIAYVIDNIIIAENLTNGNKRRVEVNGILLESKRIILKD